MTNYKDEALQTLQALVDNFIAQKTVYTSPEYNESQMRQDFLDKFFLALGWDMDNSREKYLETERSVKLEHSLKINGIKKKPDYTFTIKGKNQFFVEAKKPSVPIKYNRDTAKQIIEYGWNGSTPISILTNFEHLIIYKCAKPWRESENFTKKQIKVIHYLDYIKEFDFIWNTFAHESVLNGSINKLIKNNISPKETEPVNKAFLESLNEWRDELATNIAQRNKDLEEEAINTAVQLTIDRIVFLRVCEDREVETAEQLLKVAKSKGNTYQNLFEIFKIADQKYNSGIFDLKKDTLTPHLVIDNKVIKNILLDFYEKEANFNFALIPIEILGYAYEQFLGKVIRLEKTGKAIVEEKPEVRKAGGVYYTPEYIVQYIVENTVGKLIADKTPEEVSKIKVLDPSCGSGSFLIGAYQYLLDWHLHYYLSNPSYLKTQKDNPLTSSNLLTSKEKKRILLNNIYGVDIDMQAVEVTKLSLLLKALEGETAVSIQTSLQIFKERVLPTIDGNVQSGNSLISPDFYDAELFLTPKEERKINVFDWEFAFPTVFKQGGFDCVIGNPPYFSLDTVSEFYKNYLEEKFKKFATRQSNIYFFFMAIAHKILKENGFLSFINERYYFNSKNALKFRNFLHDNYSINEIVDFKNIQIFESVNTLTVINTFQKNLVRNDIKIVQFSDNLRKLEINKIEKAAIGNTFFMPYQYLKANDWHFSKPVLQLLKDKFQHLPTLDKILDMGQGIKSGLNEAFIVNEETIKTYKLETYLLRKYVKTKDIQKFGINFRDLYIILSLNSLDIDSTPHLKLYLEQFKTALESRYQFIDGVCKWYALSIPQNLHLFEKANEKILTPLYSKGNKFGYDNCDVNHNFYTFTDAFVLVKKDNVDISLKYILGLLNSSFMDFYNRCFGKLKRDGYYEYSRNTLSKLPIVLPDTKEKKSQYDTIIKYVNDMLNLKQRQQEGEQKLEARIHHRDKQINELVYQLYDLTEEEIKIIEGNNA